ncbi:MAG: Peptidoglycan-binding lysin protein [Firmicutes bacterium]|nr:Peptidoglycan-binding lysin protein [Bacillota bacterium]
MINKLINNESIIKTFVIALILFYAWSAYDSVQANSWKHPADGSYKIVTVGHGDTVWSIAAKETHDNEDIRGLVTAIIQANSLSDDVKIYSGQTIKIPVYSLAK